MFCTNCNKEQDSLNNGCCNACYIHLFHECYNCSEVKIYFVCKQSNDGKVYCLHCYSLLYATCYGCSREIRLTDQVIGPDECSYCNNCARRRFFRCYECRELYSREDLHRYPDHNEVCFDCFNINCNNCHTCGSILWRSDTQWDREHGFCSECYQVNSEWGMGEFANPNPTFEIIGSTRKFGIELETSNCPNHYTLKAATIWECKRDPSVEGMEFISPILYGDQGLTEIKNFCRMARQKEFEVNRYCGYHVHFDVSNESDDSLKSIAYAYCRTYNLWCQFVPDSRSGNLYCGPPDYGCDEIVSEDFDYFVGKRDRFEFVNWRAYFLHSSFEIRLYQGTLNATEICNWITLHAKFIDKIKDLTIKQLDDMFPKNADTHFDGLILLVGKNLASYWERQAEKHHKPVMQHDYWGINA